MVEASCNNGGVLYLAQLDILLTNAVSSGDCSGTVVGTRASSFSAKKVSVQFDNVPFSMR